MLFIIKNNFSGAVVKKLLKSFTIIQIIAVLSLVFLASAYFMQYFLGVIPCKLCLYQRVLYFLLVFLGVISLVGVKCLSKNILLCLCRFVIVGQMCLAGYHVGVEKGVFYEIVPCKVGLSNENIMRENWRAQIKDIQPGCKEVSLRILGFSFAEINLMLAIFLLILSFNDKRIT